MHRSRARGFSLLEVMISMAILLVGLLGMMHLQIWGLNSNQGARAQMQATQLAREIVTAVGRIPFDDPRLAPTALPVGSVLGAGGVILSGAWTFTSLPGVRPDSALEQGTSGPVYQRFMTVQPMSGSAGAKLIGVSVVYRERGSPLPREVLMYISRSQIAMLATNVTAYD
jgi:type IV pilus assembly protein PilV